MLHCYTSEGFLSRKNHIADRIFKVTTITSQSNLMKPEDTENNNAGRSVAIEATTDHAA